MERTKIGHAVPLLPVEDVEKAQIYYKEILGFDIVSTSIDWIMIKPPKSLQAFKVALEKERIRINLVIRINTDGIVYGLTYIDQKTKCVFFLHSCFPISFSLNFVSR